MHQQAILEHPEIVQHHPEAFDAFLTFSKLSPLAAEISANGLEMHYKLVDRMRGEESLRMARLLIAVFDLPMEVVLDEFRIGDFVVEAKLILKYTGQ